MCRVGNLWGRPRRRFCIGGVYRWGLGVSGDGRGRTGVLETSEGPPTVTRGSPERRIQERSGGGVR